MVLFPSYGFPNVHNSIESELPLTDLPTTFRKMTATCASSYAAASTRSTSPSGSATRFTGQERRSTSCEELGRTLRIDSVINLDFSFIIFAQIFPKKRETVLYIPIPISFTNSRNKKLIRYHSFPGFTPIGGNRCSASTRTAWSRSTSSGSSATRWPTTCGTPRRALDLKSRSVITWQIERDSFKG